MKFDKENSRVLAARVPNARSNLDNWKRLAGIRDETRFPAVHRAEML